MMSCCLHSLIVDDLKVSKLLQVLTVNYEGDTKTSEREIVVVPSAHVRITVSLVIFKDAYDTVWAC